ncbi:MAG TPA: vanadium-dependent haloperoxidase [Anaeromyxobacter sp.]
MIPIQLRPAGRALTAAIAVCAPFAAGADAVTDWNQAALRATETAGAPVPVQARAMAIVHAAIFDAVNAVEQKYAAYAVDVRAEPGASAEAAAAAAAHGILERLYPPQKAVADAALAGALAKIPEGPARAAGLRLGQDVAEKLFALRKGDGSSAEQPYAFGSGPGIYQPTPPMNANPILPQWRNVKPFLLTSARQFPFSGPPAPGSGAFAKDFNEVKRLGSRTSAERTNEQTAIAIHWAGSEVPPLNAIARAAAAAKGLTLVDDARLFALLNMAMADALIAGFEAKYTFNHWRPVTAIRNAGLAGNAATSADAAWEPLLVTPPHQEYPSAHCLGAGAAMAVLRHVFEGDRLSTSYVYPPLGVLLRWESFSQVEKEIENARVWAGIHFRTAVEHGTRFGRQVAEYGIQTHMRRRSPGAG